MSRENVLQYFRRDEAMIADRLDDTIRHHRTGKGVIQVVDKDGKGIPGVKIKVVQKDHDFRHGGNIFMLDEMETAEKNAAYRELFPKVYNLATVPFYWSDLEPEEGKPRFAKDSPKVYRRPAPDLCVEYCQEVGIEPKCHCLNYDQWTPLWVPDEIPAVKKALDKRMRECGERYRDVIPSWEVTNEFYCGKYDTFSQSRKSTQLFCDRDVIEWSFTTARKYLPTNKLIINEANGVWSHLFCYQRGAYYQQVERALDKGAPIDAVGFQFHLFVRPEDEINAAKTLYNPTHLYMVMDTYAKLGIPMQITEITIPCYTDAAEDEEIQSVILENLMKVWFSHPAMDTAIYWNLVDGYAAFAPQGAMNAGENFYRGGLCRFDLSQKPAFHMLHKLFHETWHTEAETGTDDGGWAAWRGFFGDYTCEITVDGKTTTLPLHLTKQSGNRFRIVL